MEILLCTSGEGAIEVGGHLVGRVKKGYSLLVPAAMDPYVIQGEVTIYKVAVPLLK